MKSSMTSHHLPTTLSLSSSPFSSPQRTCKNEHTSMLQFCPNSYSRSFLRCSAKKKPSLADQILDYIEGGPKLRKWYGAPDRLSDDVSVSEQEDSQEIEEQVRDTILVTDGNSEIGQMVILSLIVKRARVKVLVKDKRAAMEAFGTYVEAMTGDANDGPFLKKALRGVRAIICPNEGFISRAVNLKGLKHIILFSQLSVYRNASGIQVLMIGNAKKLAEQDESVVKSLGIPYTIIKAGTLNNSPGGTQGFSFTEGCAARGSLSKEDGAFICVEALDAVPEKGLIFEVVNGEEKVSNWKECLAALIEKSDQQFQ